MGKPTNEFKFEKLINDHLDDSPLEGKVKFKNDNIEISVDNSIAVDNIIYLIEIDAGNMAKLLIGQYVLLNVLKDYPDVKNYDFVKDKIFKFIVIHHYKKYDPERTLKNLRLINKQLFEDSGIPFAAIHIETLKKEIVRINKKEQLGAYFEELIRNCQSQKN